MPKHKKGETKSKWMSRCVPHVKKKEGKSQKAAVGKCLGMWRSHKKK